MGLMAQYHDWWVQDPFLVSPDIFPFTFHSHSHSPFPFQVSTLEYLIYVFPICLLAYVLRHMYILEKCRVLCMSLWGLWDLCKNKLSQIRELLLLLSSLITWEHMASQNLTARSHLEIIGSAAWLLWQVTGLRSRGFRVNGSFIKLSACTENLY